MIRYKIMLTFFILLAIAASCVGFHYTLISSVNIVLKTFIYIILLFEVFVDLLMLVKIWFTSTEE